MKIGQTEGPARSFANSIHARIDLDRALDAAQVPFYQRRFINALFAEPSLSERDAGAALGFSIQQTERVRRSLREDRRIGQGLRLFLAAYLPPQKKVHLDVPKNQEAA